MFHVPLLQLMFRNTAQISYESYVCLPNRFSACLQWDFYTFLSFFFIVWQFHVHGRKKTCFINRKMWLQNHKNSQWRVEVMFVKWFLASCCNLIRWPVRCNLSVFLFIYCYLTILLGLTELKLPFPLCNYVHILVYQEISPWYENRRWIQKSRSYLAIIDTEIILQQLRKLWETSNHQVNGQILYLPLANSIRYGVKGNFFSLIYCLCIVIKFYVTYST